MNNKKLLQGKVLDIQRTGEKRKDDEGKIWEKCIFTVKLTGFSKRTPSEEMPDELKGKEVKLVRWCCFSWHYYPRGCRKTLDPRETEAILKRKPINTVFEKSATS